MSTNVLLLDIECSDITVIYDHTRFPCRGATWRIVWSGKLVNFFIWIVCLKLVVC